MNDLLGGSRWRGGRILVTNLEKNGFDWQYPKGKRKNKEGSPLNLDMGQLKSPQGCQITTMGVKITIKVRRNQGQWVEMVGKGSGGWWKRGKHGRLSMEMEGMKTLERRGSLSL